MPTPRCCALSSMPASLSLGIAAVCLFSTVALLAGHAGQAQVSGAVVLDPSGRGLPGVQVTIDRVSGTQTDHVVTSPDGRFEFLELEPGAYRLTFALTGFHTAVRIALVAPGSQRAITVTLRPDPSAVVDSREEQQPGDTGAAAGIAGIVGDANGVAWPGLAVRIRRLGEGPPVELTTDSRGAFLLGVEPGVYRVVLGAQAGFRPDVRDEVVVGRGVVVRIQGRVRAAAEFEFGGGQAMAPGDGDLRLQVKDSAGHAVAAAEIAISLPDAPFDQPRVTDAVGQLWMVLAEGRYRLRVAVPGFETTIVSPVGITAGSTTHADVTLELAEKYRGGRPRVAPSRGVTGGGAPRLARRRHP